LELRRDDMIIGLTVERMPGKKDVYYARVPSQGDVYQEITKLQFKIIDINGLPFNPAQIIGWKDQKQTPIASIFHNDGSTTLAIPREILPCELELPGALETRVQVRK